MSAFPGATNTEEGFCITINGIELDVKIEDFSYEESFFSPPKWYDDDGNITKYYVVGIGTSYNNINHSKPIRFTVKDTKSKNISIISTSFEITPPRINWSESSLDIEGEKIEIPEIKYMECVSYYRWSKE